MKSIAKKDSFNTLYFGALFLSFSFFSLCPLLKQNPPFLYLVYTGLQALSEILFLVLCVHFAKTRIVLWGTLVGTGILFLSHYTSYIMLKLLDAPISYLFSFFPGRNLGHIGSVFQAINMNGQMLFLILFSLILIPFLSIFSYTVSQKISRMRPFSVSNRSIVTLFTSSFALLLCFDFFYVKNLNQMEYEKYKKTLPLGFTFFSPKSFEIHLNHPFKAKEIQKTFPLLDSSAKRPNIYLFVIETLRNDIIESKIAPILHEFGKENVNIERAYSSANATHLSWYSIFHSLFPYHWNQNQEKSFEGSLPLKVLKSAGYKIHVYSSTDLKYFEMDQAIFGKNLEIADTIRDFSNQDQKEVWEKDDAVISAFENDLKDRSEANVFIFFLDSTHSEYSFPIRSAKFFPIVDQIGYLSFTEDQIEKVKNRYRNSVSYIDSLLDRFFSIVKERDLYKDAVIAITGDHGEEFYEEGALFHGTHLNRFQTNVPMLFKLGDRRLDKPPLYASHVDIFPSILNHIDPKLELPLDGKSILLLSDSSFRLSVLQNGALLPKEFIIESEEGFIRAKFVDPQKIYKEPNIEILEESGIGRDLLKVTN